MTCSNPHDTIRLEEEVTASPIPLSKPLSAYQEDHARLTPINNAAKRAFHEIALIVKSDQGWNPHARRFVYIDEIRATDQNSDSGSSDEDLVSPYSIEPFLTGHYRLNLAILPAKFANGWIIGAGRNKPTEANVDILISINGHRDNVRTRHARIVYHRDSRASMIGALPKKAVLLNGQEIKDQAHVLSQSQGLVIGNLAYRLEFLQIDKAKYIEALDMIVTRSRRWSHGNHTSFDPTPSNNHFELHGYQFQTPQAAGAYGVVSACLQLSTGNLYAVKRVQRTMKSFGLVNMEVITMQRLGEHPHVCSLVDTFYSDGDGFSMGGSSVNDVYMILNPWAPQSMADFAATQPTVERLTLAYHQGAQGIRHLHRSGFIHRDVKLANLLVSTLHPLCVVVADFGHATSAPDTEATGKKHRGDLQNHMKGTISYHPPEITALKNATDMLGQWSKASDVFTYGLVGIELFHGRFRRSRDKCCVDASVHRSLHQKLKTGSSMDELLASMLQWKASDRPTMDQVLLRPLWPSRETSSSASKRKTYQDSEDETCEHPGKEQKTSNSKSLLAAQ